MKKKISLLILSIILVLVILGSTTYALFFKQDKLDNVESYTAGILDIVVDNSEEGLGEVLTLASSLPLTDEEGKNTTAYKFKITNKGNLAYTFDLKLLSTTVDNAISSNYIKVMIDDNEPVLLSSLTNSIVESNITLNPSDSKIISVRIWLDESTPNSEIGKTFSGKLVSDGVASEKEKTLSEQTLTKLGVTVNSNEVTTFGKIPYVTESELTTLCTNAGHADLATCLSNEYSVSTYSELMATGYVSTVNDNGIFAAEDDLGTSYYYRGNVENNYVYFAGIYWRIMRINGDGTIRLIYDGPTKKHNGTMGEDNIVRTTAYNTNYKDNAYVGYMYGTPNSDYTNTHKNTTSSTIKGVNDKWYEDTIIAGGYDKYVADAIYCNNRKVTPGSYFGDEFTGDGTGTTVTFYDSLARIYGTTVSPSLKCSQDNDKFSTTAIGNGDLTYPIGLATTDELVMSGYFSYGLANDVSLRSLSSYSFNHVPFWTMSPAIFNDGNANVCHAGAGKVYSHFSVAIDYGVMGLRPVVSLKSDTPFSSGDGSYEQPFVVG